jgi:uncharacterized protein (TIGR02466 family)
MILSENFSLIPLFSKPIYLNKINISLKEEKILKKEIEKLKFIKIKNSVSMSENIEILKINELNFFLKKLIKEVENYTKNILKYENNFMITTSWITNTKINEVSTSHRHTNSMLSGVFYIECDEKLDAISFTNFNGSGWGLKPKEYNIYNSSEYKIVVKKHSLILFPSETVHRIEKHNIKKERISIAFNLIPTGLIGENDSTLQIA